MSTRRRREWSLSSCWRLCCLRSSCPGRLDPPQADGPGLVEIRRVLGELRRFAVVEGRDVECENGEPSEHKAETIIPGSRIFIRTAAN
jgi:hypothetical protein